MISALVGELREHLLPVGTEGLLRVEVLEDHADGLVDVDRVLVDLLLRLRGAGLFGEHVDGRGGEVVAHERTVVAEPRGPLQPGADEEVAVGLGEHAESDIGGDAGGVQGDPDTTLQVEALADDVVRGGVVLGQVLDVVLGVLTAAAGHVEQGAMGLIQSDHGGSAFLLVCFLFCWG